MKSLRLLLVLAPLIFLTSASQTMVITFSFDLYLAEVQARDLGTDEGYKELADIIWEQAQYLASARIYGLRFNYFSPASWNAPADFTATPQALIAKGNKQLSIKKINQLSPSHFEVSVRYVLTPEETVRYRRFQERSTTLLPAQGAIPYNPDTIFFKKALENSFYQAIRAYAQERNLSSFEGQFLIMNNQPLLIKSGFAIQYSQIQLIVETPAPFSV